MSAPPSEAESDVGEVVFIAIKVEGGGDGASAYTPKDNQDIFKSDCIVEIERKWLASEFFEAPTKRWKFDENSQTCLTLLLPEGCVASEGARLLKLRLGSAYFRKKQNPASTAQERAWSPVDWWMATSGRSSSLFGALYLFNYTLQKDFATEVAETLKLYCIKCPHWVATIAQELQVSVQKVKLVEPRKTDLKTLEKLVEEALKHNTDERYQTLVERALAGCEDTPEGAMKILVRAWFSLFRWEAEPQQVTDDAAPRQPTMGTPLGHNRALPWLLGLVEDLVQEHPAEASTCHKELISCLGAKGYGMYKVLRTNSTSGITSSENHHASFSRDNVERLRAVCAHSLFLKSRLDWPCTIRAFANFCNLSCAMVRYSFTDGSVIDTRPFIDPRVFAIAHPEAQRLWFEASPAKSLAVFKDSAHLVHSGVRHFLLRSTSALSDKDIDFLADAEDSPEKDDCTDASPQAKKQRRS